MSQIFRFFRKPATPRLTAIYVAASAGLVMRSIDCVEAVKSVGLKGDRYYEKTGFWKSVDGCEVTLITQREIDVVINRAPEALQQQIEAGAHRRNLVIAGLAIKQLEARSFVIGTAVFRYKKPRPPCAYIDRVAGKGMCRALGKRSGVCLEVIRSGSLSVGDRIEIID